MTMRALRFSKYGPPSVLTLERRDVPVPGPGEVLIQVKASAINPSDIRNVEGVFHTPLPRTPGRDYAGIVVGGDAAAGLEVWGSGPRFGIARDGAHADFAVIAADWVSEKPSGLSMVQAASVGVPFITAWSALVTEGRDSGGRDHPDHRRGRRGGARRDADRAWKGARVIPAIRARGQVPAGTIDTEAPDMPRPCGR